MVNVTCKPLLFLIAATTFLAGCEDPAVSVSTLGRKLAAPVLTSSSPFDQDMDTQNYVEITGTCDPRVGPVVISFDDINYHSAPTSPDTSNTTLGSVTNDNDCSDGKFDIYVTAADLLSIWGITVNSDSSSVDNIYIKGSTFFGDTRTLTIPDPKKGSGENVGSAAKLALRKIFPKDFGGAGQCEMFTVFVTDANGNETSTGTAATFSVNPPAGTSISTYKSIADCSSSYSPQTSFTIAANKSQLQIYVKMPTTPIDTVLGFTVTSLSGGLTAATAATPVTLRDPASSHRFISMTDAPGTLYKNVCYPITMQRLDYNKTSGSMTDSISLTLAPSDAKLLFYTADDCNSSSKTSSVFFASYVSQSKIYVRYEPGNTTSTTNFTKVEVNYTVSDANYDNPSFPVRVDLSNKTTIANVDFWGPTTVSRSYCSPYTVVTANGNWTPVPADKDYTFNFSSSSTVAGLEFYSDSNCTNALSNLVVTQGAVMSKVYVKSSAGQNSTSVITMTATGMNPVSREVSVSVVATGFGFETAPSYTLAKGSCNYVMLTLNDYAGIIPALNPINLAFSNSSGAAAGDVTLYTDSSCSSTAFAENVYAPIAPYNSNQYKFYIKLSSSYSGSSLSLIFNGTGLLTLPIMYGNFSVTGP
ncbi:hypothetical protein DOM22_02435 [Bdellovibrio sp. ZAP7]|uniref:hypothetical protein n=1 Tax=Bdellovibrio sp. ZAP7 TaxID=2231053 RepID=UPI001158BDA5|nr:hypothetical protein [Bdellovibrio sp. ZAP7]QDK44094.1 hypothetical protein DOM22_02435 [Bdellovibrio sp. ZAP7]